jgi:hypothetical protein
METNIIEVIQNVGFPIFLVLALGYFVWKLYLQSVEREKTLYAEIANSRLVNEKAIDTIARYAEKLDIIQTDIKEIKNDITIIKTKE